MKLGTPLFDRIVVKRSDAETTTAGGLIIPHSVKQDKPYVGEVVAAGPGRRTEKGELVPMQTKVGDQVMFSKYSGTDVKLDEIEYVIMREEDILMIM